MKIDFDYDTVGGKMRSVEIQKYNQQETKHFYHGFHAYDDIIIYIKSTYVNVCHF